jgi:hypothetical protein
MSFVDRAGELWVWKNFPGSYFIVLSSELVKVDGVLRSLHTILDFSSDGSSGVTEFYEKHDTHPFEVTPYVVRLA